MPAGRDGMRRDVAAHSRLDDASRSFLDLVLVWWAIERNEVRAAFLQEKLGGLHARIGVIAGLHDVGVQAVVERHEAHPVMVSHIRFHDGASLSGRQALFRVIDRLVETHRAERAFGFEVLEIFQHLLRANRRGEQAGVGCNDQIVGQTAFQSDARHAKRAVLIVRVYVLHVVGGFRDSPRDTERFCVLDVRLTRLRRSRSGACAGRCASREGHQVLEHRRAPRHQGAVAADRRHQASELEPVLLRDASHRDGDKAGQAGSDANAS